MSPGDNDTPIVERHLAELVPAPEQAEDTNVVATPAADTGQRLALGGRRPPADLAPEHIYLASLAASGRRSMAARLRAVARLLGAAEIAAVPWEQLRYQHIVAIKTALVDQGLAAASVNTTLAALRGVAQAAWNLHYLPVEELERIRTIKPVRGSRLPAGRAVEAAELRALLQVCAADDPPAGARDAALIAVLYAGGLRRSELAGLQRADYTPDSRALRVRQGKGGKERMLYLAAGAGRALAAWLACRGDRPGALFMPINKGGRIADRPLTAQAVYNILTKRATAAGLAESISPHDLRRTFVGDLLDAGADIATVQQLAGHANVTTTARYDRRGEAVKKRAADLLQVPYGPADPAGS